MLAKDEQVSFKCCVVIQVVSGTQTKVEAIVTVSIDIGIANFNLTIRDENELAPTVEVEAIDRMDEDGSTFDLSDSEVNIVHRSFKTETVVRKRACDDDAIAIEAMSFESYVSKKTEATAIVSIVA